MGQLRAGNNAPRRTVLLTQPQPAACEIRKLLPRGRGQTCKAEIPVHGKDVWDQAPSSTAAALLLAILAKQGQSQSQVHGNDFDVLP